MVNLKGVFPETSKFRLRVIKCCSSMITKPTPNSTAEKIRKKNVNDSRLRLSYARPIRRVREYKVIQRSSAVNNRCSDVLVLVVKVLSKKRKSRSRMFVSPKNKISLVS